MTATNGQQPNMAHQRSSLERVYVILSGDDRCDRACEPIPDAECSRKVLFFGGLVGSAAGLAALSMEIIPPSLRSPYLVAGLFILLGVPKRVSCWGAKPI